MRWDKWKQKRKRIQETEIVLRINAIYLRKVGIFSKSDAVQVDLAEPREQDQIVDDLAQIAPSGREVQLFQIGAGFQQVHKTT